MVMLYLKKALQFGANLIGYDIVRRLVKPPNSLNLLDLAILAVIQDQKDFFFLQIGANDGILEDPLRSLILARHLEGVLVEPLPDKFAELQRNYAHEKQLRFENCAVAKKNGECSLFRVVSPSPYPQWAQ